MILLILSLGLSGCLSGPKLSTSGQLAQRETGTIQARAFLDSSQLDGWPVSVSFVQNKTIITQDTVVSGNQIDIASPRLFVGDWQVELKVFDWDGYAVYQGVQDITVRADTTASAEIALRPAKGTLKVTMDLREFAYVEGTIKGRLLTNEDVYENFTISDVTVPVEATLELDPHDYDIAIGLYKDAYYTYDRFFLSPYQKVSITPGRTTEIHWTPPMGAIDIGIVLDDEPAPPDMVELSWSGQHTALLSWTPSPSTDTVAYNIYFRTDSQFSGFTLWGTAPAGQSQLTVDVADLADLTDSSVLYAVITTIDASGNESSRSSEARLDIGSTM